MYMQARRASHPDEVESLTNIRYNGGGGGCIRCVMSNGGNSPIDIRGSAEMNHSMQSYCATMSGLGELFVVPSLIGVFFSLLLVRLVISSSGSGFAPYQNSAPVLRTRGTARGGSPRLPKLLSENSVPLPRIVSDGVTARRLCILTREFRGLANGGIGTAMAELAEVLASKGVPVSVVLTERVDVSALSRAHKQLAGLDIDIISNPKVDLGYPIKGDGAQWRSYALFSWLKAFQDRCYTVLYHEWEGIGFHIATSTKALTLRACTSLWLGVRVRVRPRVIPPQRCAGRLAAPSSASTSGSGTTLAIERMRASASGTSLPDTRKRQQRR